MTNDPTPEYLDLLLRASKVRHFLVKNPLSEYKTISEAFFPMRIPMKWLLMKGYVIRRKNPMAPERYAPVYEALPMGVPYEPEEFHEESPTSPQAVADGGES